MIVYIIAVILAVLIVITMLHDISIFRLERKVDMLQTFIDVTMRQLEEYALGQKANTDQRIQSVESIEQTAMRKLEEFKADVPIVQDTAQTDCPWK